MTEFLNIVLPLFVFMTLPLWLPIFVIIGGAIHDRIRPVRVTPTQLAVEAAKERSARGRRLISTQLVGQRHGGTVAAYDGDQRAA